MNINVDIKTDKLPYKGSKYAAGYDLYAVSRKELTYNLVEYETNASIKIPEGYVGLIFPRSSIYKTGLTLINSVGVIDSDYIGVIKAIFIRHGNKDLDYQIGDRICQLVIVPVCNINFNVVDSLENTERGTNGFGSSGVD